MTYEIAKRTYTQEYQYLAINTHPLDPNHDNQSTHHAFYTRIKSYQNYPFTSRE